MTALLVRCVIDRFQVVCKRFFIFIGNVFERIPDDMNDASLILGHGKCCRYGLLDAG